MKGVPGTIAAIVLILCIIGLVMVASTSMLGADGFAQAVSFKRQLMWMALAVAGMLALSRIDYHLLAKLSPWLLAGTVLLLAAVLSPNIGTFHGGARRWIRFLGFGVQPSEMAKLAVILFLSAWLSRNADRVKSFKYGLLPVLAVVGLVGALTMLEPDLGTSGLIILVGVTLGVLAGVRLRHLAPFAVPAALLAHYLVFVLKMRYDRILAFLDPWKYYDGAGYQLCQALIGLGKGGIFGMGIGESSQKLGFLPEARNDFIFAILGEELGLAGTLTVLLLFAAFVWYGFHVARRAKDLLGYLVASGVTVTIGVQALINMAVVTGAVPTKGISLPFISFGGSSLFFLMCSVGVLLNVARQAERAEAVLPVEPAPAEA